jgi:hypothetical protein
MELAMCIEIENGKSLHAPTGYPTAEVIAKVRKFADDLERHELQKHFAYPEFVAWCEKKGWDLRDSKWQVWKAALEFAKWKP